MEFVQVLELLLNVGTPGLLLLFWWLERQERQKLQEKIDRLTGIIQTVYPEKIDR